MTKPTFTFIDLFAGIGGFHAALSAMGGKCVYASEIDVNASRIYKSNWGIDPFCDLTEDANDLVMNVPKHDVLTAGFPCQPFSKSGAQRGMEETRGTLYWNILKIIQTHHPKLVVLENVRNLAGPRHLHEWEVIIATLRNEGYRVSSTPAIFSPHLLPPHLGGRPQVRERVFITATYVGKDVPDSELDAQPPFLNSPVAGWNPQNWNLERDLPLDSDDKAIDCGLSDTERLWVDAWNDFVVRMLKARKGERLPGFPLWADEWIDIDELKIPKNTPKWKADYLRKNSEFYSKYKKTIDVWTKKWDIYGENFPPSRRKLEWQAQDTPNLLQTVMHFRPSGIRAKAPTYVPALVAITQTSIVGSRYRRLSTREAARLQGLPDSFRFDGQPSSATYKQLGNGVSVGAVWFVLRAHAERDKKYLQKKAPKLLEAIRNSPENPDEAFSDH